MKPGYKTTEAVAVILSGAGAHFSGLLEHSNPYVVMSTVLGVAIVAGMYQYTRMRVKIANPIDHRLRGNT